MIDTIHSKVSCYSGYTYAQRPLAFIWLGDLKHVNAVLQEWHTVDGKRFWVSTAGGEVFTLKYDSGSDLWQVNDTLI